MAELVTIARFHDLSEAWAAKGFLEAAGIPCFVADENIVAMNWLWAGAVGGVRLQVSSEYVETASDLLTQQRAEDGKS